MKRFLSGLLLLALAVLPAGAQTLNSYSFVTGGNRLCQEEAQCFTIDATVPGGSVYTRDTTTPANNLNNVSLDKSNLVQTGTSPKFVHWGASPFARWAPHNFMLQSQDLATTWTNTNTTETVNSSVAPDGTSTADTLTSDGAVGARIAQTWTTVAGFTYTISGYFKTGTNGDYVMIEFQEGSAGVYGWADLTNCAIGTTTTYGGFTHTTPMTATNAGNGWCRVTATTTVAGTGATFHIYPAIVDNAADTGVSDTILVWGLQANRGWFATDHITTTSAIKYGIPQGYDIPTARHGIQMEPAATNLHIRSEELDNAAWSKNGTSPSVIGTNALVAPGGSTTGDTIADQDQGGSVSTTTGVTVSSATNYTLSLYVKVSGITWVRLYFGNSGGNAGTNTYYDVVNMAHGSTPNSQGGAVIISNTIEDVGNGWRRIKLTQTTATTSIHVNLRSASADNSGTRIVDGSTYAMWGVQVELGLAGSSYIPTAGTSITRNVDVINAATSTMPFQQNPGSMYADYTTLDASTSRWIVDFQDGVDNQDLVGFLSGTSPRLEIQSAGSIVSNTDLGANTNNVRAQLSASWTTNDADASLDGAAASNDATAAMPTGMSQLRLGNAPTASVALQGYLYRFVYVPRHVENDANNLETWRYNF